MTPWRNAVVVAEAAEAAEAVETPGAEAAAIAGL